MTDDEDERMLSLATQFPADDEVNIAFSDYSCALGRVVYSWNRLHERLGELFAAVVSPGARAIPVAVWHSQSNDRAQRNMLLEAVKAAPPEQWKTRPEGNPRPKAKDELL